MNNLPLPPEQFSFLWISVYFQGPPVGSLNKELITEREWQVLRPKITEQRHSSADKGLIIGLIHEEATGD